MAAPPAVRKATLVLHVASSVGWLGAAVAFLSLALAASTSRDEWLVRAAYTVMEPLGTLALVPLAIASLATGVLQSLLSPWGLVRHYWVLVKLLITVAATSVLVVYMQTLASLAGSARDTSLVVGPGGALPSLSPVLHAGAGVAALLVALGLSIYKPKGVSGYGFAGRRHGFRSRLNGR